MPFLYSEFSPVSSVFDFGRRVLAEIAIDCGFPDPDFEAGGGHVVFFSVPCGFGLKIASSMRRTPHAG
jgi:hypothetical protein